MNLQAQIWGVASTQLEATKEKKDMLSLESTENGVRDSGQQPPWRTCGPRAGIFSNLVLMLSDLGIYRVCLLSFTHNQGRLFH
jgi:hypothetical protein